jgi:transcriptional regulator with XRE-family HTH domain
MATKKARRPARETFAANMRRSRLTAGHSQEALAELCGLHRNYVGSVERGERNISIDNMEAIAAALNTTIAVLVTEGPDE